ncbi:hypothetical protein IHE44_0009482 [Lamprotornis superbus]|uniref:Methyltransferase domain-containing protein n=1 Tax=Lamprotornis superbus TaxID=245042 RepID=A0A835U4E3_9PASS|nr:hypothetical protein IHE44_0009482 [Lamprotornis superbus]
MWRYMLGNDDNQFELSMANSGCEVHRFDPSIKAAHVQQGQHLWYHRLSIDWRDPNPAIAAHKLHSSTKKLGTVLNEFGHHKMEMRMGKCPAPTDSCCAMPIHRAGAQPLRSPSTSAPGISSQPSMEQGKIDVLKADVESAEWKILENLILEDVVEQIGQLVFEVHIHWPGFEVSGNDSTVVRYWYSLLRELELKDFRLFHTYKDLSKPQMFLKKEAFNATLCLTTLPLPGTRRPDPGSALMLAEVVAQAGFDPIVTCEGLFFECLSTVKEQRKRAKKTYHPVAHLKKMELILSDICNGATTQGATALAGDGDRCLTGVRPLRQQQQQQLCPRRTWISPLSRRAAGTLSEQRAWVAALSQLPEPCWMATESALARCDVYLLAISGCFTVQRWFDEDLVVATLSSIYFTPPYAITT